MPFKRHILGPKTFFGQTSLILVGFYFSETARKGLQQGGHLKYLIKACSQMYP